VKLAAALDHLLAGDTLVVWHLDRLGRLLAEPIDLMTQPNKEGIAFRDLTE
jgi:Enterobacteriaceae phage serine recombinase